MSRVGKKPISIPDKVDVSLQDRLVTVKGSKGTLSRTIHDDVNLDINGNVIQVMIQNEDRKSRALQGLTRSLVDNMVTGVSNGFERVLEINGIGYRARPPFASCGRRSRTKVKASNTPKSALFAKPGRPVPNSRPLRGLRFNRGEHLTL